MKSAQPSAADLIRTNLTDVAPPLTYAQAEAAMRQFIKNIGVGRGGLMLAKDRDGFLRLEREA